MKRLMLNIWLILMVALLSECTVNKRHYRSGYQVSWNKSKTKKSNQAHNESIKLLDHFDSNQLSHQENEEVLYVSTQNTIPHLTKKRTVNAISLPDDSCGDIITMLNGEEISAKIIEINQRTVKYRSCENLGGPLFVESQEKMFMIRYANGTKEVFTKKAVSNSDGNKSNNIMKNAKAKTGVSSGKKINSMALASLICSGAFFLYFPLVLAPIFAIIACVQFNNHPDKYKAKGMVVPALIIGAIIVTVLIILLAGII